MSLRSADSSRLGSSSRKSRWPALGCDDLPIVSRCLAARAGREYVIADVIMAVDVDSHSTRLARLLVVFVACAGLARECVRLILQCRGAGLWCPRVGDAMCSAVVAVEV